MRARLAAGLLATLALAGCERTMRDMYEQPKLGPDAGSPLWRDGKAARPPVPGTFAIASGDLAQTSGGRHGRDELAAHVAAEAASEAPVATPALLARGRARYDIVCAPCHSPTGDGDGMVVRRGFPRPPSLHDPRLRAAPDRALFDAITQGVGVMVPMADRATPADRWAIVAYVRALQLSQAMPVAELPPTLRQALRAQPAAPTSPASGARTPS